jgi:hypothetical protein
MRTRGLFSAMEKMVGVKGKKDVDYVYFVSLSQYYVSISVPELYSKCIGMKQGKTTRSPVLRGVSAFSIFV